MAEVRYICLDTETTGGNVRDAHKILEIGCVEVINGVKGRTYQTYLNPERSIDDGAFKVHGISLEKVKDAPRFSDIYTDLLVFIEGATLVIHNAPFDMGFLNYELSGVGMPQLANNIIDTINVSRRVFPGQRASLDALCERLAIDNSHRTSHGALLDADLLADVFIYFFNNGNLDVKIVNYIKNNEFIRKQYVRLAKVLNVVL